MITPRDIANVQFKLTRIGAGYSQQEVDKFLDDLVEDYESVLRRLGAAEEDARKAKQALANAASGSTTVSIPKVADPAQISAVPSLQSIQLMLDAAQAAADKVMSDAQLQAGQIVAQAHAQAAQAVADAKGAAAQAVGELEVQRGEIEKKVRSLGAIHGQLLAGLQHSVQDLGAVVEAATKFQAEHADVIAAPAPIPAAPAEQLPPAQENPPS